MSMLDALFTTEAMQAAFSDRARLQGMLDFEAALARVEARLGVVPAGAADVIASHCRAELYDIDALARAAALAGNTAIPLVKALTARVARADAEAARYVHWGATSQDAMDTGLVLQLRAAFTALEQDLERLAAALARLAELHRRTPMAGRTWLQQAAPITFGLKAAGWLSALERDRERLRAARARALVLQLGGAVGTLAALGEQGMAVAAAIAEELDLALPECPWHGQRDRMAETAAALGLLTGGLGKMARDVSLMAQTEVGEVAEPQAPGRGGSSTLPHKRNPVGSAVMLAAAARVPGLVATMLTGMVQEHERGLGGWHAEWNTLPEIFRASAGAAAQAAQVMAGLEVDAARMRANLDATRGLVMAEAVGLALARHIGRAAAHEAVESASQRAIEQGSHLREVLAADPQVGRHLSAADLERLFDPAGYLGSSEALVRRVLAGRRNQTG